MTPKKRADQVRQFILSNVEGHASDISFLTAGHFGISRQAVNRHLQKLASQNVLDASGNTRHRVYRLAIVKEKIHTFQISPLLEEHKVWSDEIAPLLDKLPLNIVDIWQFAFTEIFNNAIDHSEGSNITVHVFVNAAYAQIIVFDDGIGIFRKIQAALNLADERHAILELAKGKVTTDPERHTGQGIFFTSRLLDEFNMFSGGVFFSHDPESEKDWILEKEDSPGTAVFLKLNNASPRTCKSVFDRYSSGDDYGFTRTVVPVKLARYGQDKLISRSEAKRLVSRVDRFKEVFFDFAEIDSIGQSFADEIFRVFAKSHPEIEIVAINAVPRVQGMINSARAQWARDIGGV